MGSGLGIIARHLRLWNLRPSSGLRVVLCYLRLRIGPRIGVVAGYI